MLFFFFRLHAHLLGHAGQALFVLASVDSPVGQERVKEFLLFFEQGAFSLVRRHCLPVGLRGRFKEKGVHFLCPAAFVLFQLL